MLGEIALKHYKNGESCCTCILKACEEFYKMPLICDVYDMTSGFCNGFSINGMCSALVTGVMFISYYFKSDENKMKRARIYFFNTLHGKLGATNCGKLQKCCKKAIYESGEALEETIIKYG